MNSRTIYQKEVQVYICDTTKGYARVLLAAEDQDTQCYAPSARATLAESLQSVNVAAKALTLRLHRDIPIRDLLPLAVLSLQDREIHVFLYEKDTEGLSSSDPISGLPQMKWFGLDTIFMSVCKQLSEEDYSSGKDRTRFLVPPACIRILRRHYYPHCTNKQVRQAEAEINALLQPYGEECKVYFLRTTATIVNSWKVDSKEIRHRICRLIEQSGVTSRTFENLSAEWEVHNVAYQAHVGRSHAKDVDLDYNKDPRMPVRLATEIFDRLDIE